MTDAFGSMPNSLHALAKNGDSIVLFGDSIGITRGDVLEQRERNGGVAAGSGAQGHVGVKHRMHLVTSRRSDVSSSHDWHEPTQACAARGHNADRTTRSDCAAFPVGSLSETGASTVPHPPARISPVLRLVRIPLGGAGVGVAAYSPKVHAVTPTSIIVRHRCSNDLHDVAKDDGGSAVQREAVQIVEAVEEGVNHVVRHIRIAHCIDDRCGHVGQGHDRDPRLVPSFPVFRHAPGIAA